MAFNHGHTPEWVELIAFGLRDILRSRIGPEQRNPALQLSSIMSQHYSMGWTLLVPVTEKRCVHMQVPKISVAIVTEPDNMQDYNKTLIIT